LLSDYLDGDEMGFSTLVARYHGEMLGFLTRLMGDRAAAEDVLQETFLRVHRSAHQFEHQRGLRPWMFSIAANAAKDLYRWNLRRPALSMHAPSGFDGDWSRADLADSSIEPPSRRLERNELAQRVRAEVELMPVHLREILALAYFSQLPYRQISQTLNIPLGTVKSRLHAAVAHFAARWGRTHAAEGRG